jgi:hypothetical protein
MTECRTDARNPIDARLTELLESVSRWSALFVGALTVVLAEFVVEAIPLGNTASSLSLFPVSLVIIYGLLRGAAALEEGWR